MGGNVRQNDLKQDVRKTKCAQMKNKKQFVYLGRTVVHCRRRVGGSGGGGGGDGGGGP